MDQPDWMVGGALSDEVLADEVLADGALTVKLRLPHGDLARGRGRRAPSRPLCAFRDGAQAPGGAA